MYKEASVITKICHRSPQIDNFDEYENGWGNMFFVVLEQEECPLEKLKPMFPQFFSEENAKFLEDVHKFWKKFSWGESKSPWLIFKESEGWTFWKILVFLGFFQTATQARKNWTRGFPKPGLNEFEHIGKTKKFISFFRTDISLLKPFAPCMVSKKDREPLQGNAQEQIDWCKGKGEELQILFQCKKKDRCCHCFDELRDEHDE